VNPSNRRAERAQRNRPTKPVSDRRRNLIVATIAVVIGATGGLYALVALRGGSANGSGSPAYVVGSPGPGKAAPQIALRGTSGAFDLSSARRRGPVLLYFQEGLTCQPCWDQLKAIQLDADKFAALGVSQIVSITSDPLDALRQKTSDEGLRIPVLSDPGLAVSRAYQANRYGMMGTSRDGHSFVLVGQDGVIRWRADYGGPPNYTMFVNDSALLAALRDTTKRQ
jgi:peroxiredoxin